MIAQDHTIYERRAADALRALIGGPSADKLTARAFGCSVRLAQRLRAGQCWTIQRLTQASALFGVAFDRALYVPASNDQYYAKASDLADRLAELEAWREEVVGGNDARPASARSDKPGERSEGSGAPETGAYRAGARS